MAAKTKPQLIVEKVRLKKVVQDLQAKFPEITILAFYAPSQIDWHLCCDDYFVYKEKKYQNWLKVLRKKHKVKYIGVVIHKITATMVYKRLSKENKDLILIE